MRKASGFQINGGSPIPISGVNAWYEEELRQQYHRDPSSIDVDWKKFFEQTGSTATAISVTAPLAAPLPQVDTAAGTLTSDATAEELIPLRGAAARLQGRLHILQDKSVPQYVSILRIHGPFLFGATEKLEQATANLNALAPVVILRLRNMTALDATGLYALEKLAFRLRKCGKTLLLCGARSQPERLLAQGEFVEHVGSENILPHIAAALERAQLINEQFGGLGSEVAAEIRGQSL